MAQMLEEWLKAIWGLLTPRIRISVRIHTQSKIQEKKNKMIQLNNQALFQTDTFPQMVLWKAYLFESGIQRSNIWYL